MIYERTKFYRNNPNAVDELGNNVEKFEMFDEGISFFTYWNEKDVNFERFIKTGARKLLTTTKIDRCDVVEIERKTEERGVFIERYKVNEIRSYGKFTLLVVAAWPKHTT